jgi:hypothetical protein
MNNNSTTFEILKSQPKNKSALRNVIIDDNGPNLNPIFNTITFWTTSKELKLFVHERKELRGNIYILSPSHPINKWKPQGTI